MGVGRVGVETRELLAVTGHKNLVQVGLKQTRGNPYLRIDRGIARRGGRSTYSGVTTFRHQPQ